MKSNKNHMSISNRILNLSLYILIVTLIQSCSLFDKDDKIKPTRIETKQANVSIVFPDLSQINNSEYTIHTVIDQKRTNNLESRLSFPKQDEYSILFVSNDEGKVIMMGVAIDGADTVIVNDTTTTIAMILLSPFIHNLNLEARIEAITFFKSNSFFKEIVNLVSLSIMEEKEIFDLSNLIITHKIDEMINNLMGERIGFQERFQVDFTNDKAIFTNKHGCAYFLNIYDKSGVTKLSKPILLKEKELFHWGISEWIENGSFLGNAEPYTHSLENNNYYRFSASSGFSVFTNLGSDTQEELFAYRRNVLMMAIEILSAGWPSIKLILDDANCVEQLSALIGDELMLALDLSILPSEQITNKELYEIVIKFIGENFSGILASAVACIDFEDAVFAALETYIGYLATFIHISEIIDASINGGMLIYDFVFSPHHYEYCIEKLDNINYACSNIVLDGTYSIYDINNCEWYEDGTDYVLGSRYQLTLDVVQGYNSYFKQAKISLRCFDPYAENISDVDYFDVEYNINNDIIIDGCINFGNGYCDKLNLEIILIDNLGNEAQPYDMVLERPENANRNMDVTRITLGK